MSDKARLRFEFQCKHSTARSESGGEEGDTSRPRALPAATATRSAAQPLGPLSMRVLREDTPLTP
jgi:hypothetical protein